MSFATTSGDYQPIRYLGRVPIYATTIITAALGAGVIVFTILASLRIDPVELLGFSTYAFANGALWQPLTYILVNAPSFFTVLGLWCFYSWAMESERYLGRTRFLKLFAALVLVEPIVCGLWRAVGLNGSVFGSYQITAAFLVAFATIYPGIEYFGWIPLKWFAFACCAVGSLMYFPAHDWFGLSLLWAEIGAAFGFVRLIQRGGSVEFADLAGKLNPFKRRPKFRVVPSPAQRTRGAADEVVDSIDPLLEKIAKSGIASLTPGERARLEKAREALMKKEDR